MKYRAFEKYVVGISIGLIGLMFMSEPASASIDIAAFSSADKPVAFAVGLISTYIGIKLVGSAHTQI